MQFQQSMKSYTVLLIALLFTACGQQNKRDANLIIINVLDPAYYNDAHIKGSINIPFDKLEKEAQSLNKKARIVLYCANYACGSSSQGVVILRRLGFEHVYAYEGGMAEWLKLGYPYEGPAQERYLKVIGEPQPRPGIDIVEGKVLHQWMEQEGFLK